MHDNHDDRVIPDEVLLERRMERTLKQSREKAELENALVVDLVPTIRESLQHDIRKQSKKPEEL